MMIEFGDVYINPYNISSIAILDGNLLSITEVVVTMNSGEKHRDIFDTYADAEDFVELIATAISPELEATEEDDEDDQVR